MHSILRSFSSIPGSCALCGLNHCSCIRNQKVQILCLEAVVQCPLPCSCTCCFKFRTNGARSPLLSSWESLTTGTLHVREGFSPLQVWLDLTPAFCRERDSIWRTCLSWGNLSRAVYKYRFKISWSLCKNAQKSTEKYFGVAFHLILSYTQENGYEKGSCEASYTEEEKKKQYFQGHTMTARVTT